MMLRLLLCVFVVVVVVDGKTVRYSNVPPRASITTKTYDLEVPGSAPIRIIEAEPIWASDEVPSTTPSYLDGLEHRSTKYKTGKEYVTTQPTKTTLSQPLAETLDDSTAYSSQALNVFLKDYADKVKADRKKYDEEDATEGLSETETENNRPKSWGLVDTKSHNHPFEDKKGWVTLEAVPWSSSKISKWQSNHKNGPKPWETSGNRPGTWTHRPTHDLEYDTSNDDNYNKYNNKHNSINGFNSHDNNFNGYSSNDNNYNYNKQSNKPAFNNPVNGFIDFDNDSKHPESSFNKNNFAQQNANKFGNVFSNNKFNTHNPNDQYNPSDNIFSDKPYAMYDVHIKPSTRPETVTATKPMYGYDLRPVQVKPTWQQEEVPSRPSWTKPPPAIFSNKPLPDPWFDRRPVHQSGYDATLASNNDEHKDIITDGRPGDFPSKPTPYPTYEQRPVVSARPATHPEHGNGEWVLVSTTKGYQYPRSKHQRSIEVTPDSIGTRRGIRLTVLPPDRDSAVNMTTSHGGLLEVESTFHSVEESHKLFSERLKAGNKTRLTNKIRKKPMRQQIMKNPKRPGKQMPVVHKQDATAVLAAVGAGMVPATMAMLVPFVTGKRRRRNITAGSLIDTVPKVIGYSGSKGSRI